MTERELRQLDRRVAYEVMGDELVPDDPDNADSPHWWISPDGTRYCAADGGPAKYSTDIGATWRVVDVLRERFTNLSLYADNGWCCRVWTIVTAHPDVVFSSGNQPTPQLAVCYAALNAMQQSD